MYLGLEHARAATRHELQHCVVGAEAEELPRAAGNAAQMVPHVAEVQLLVDHSEIRLQRQN